MAKNREKREKKQEDIHWADKTAARIIELKGDKSSYTVASGITPSGVVHIGNFREIITVDLVARALRKKGKKVRFIYSWDDYDVFRKVPKDMPHQEMLNSNLRKPIVDVPDPFGKEESYARHNEVEVEKSLPLVGINPEFIYQAKEYRKCRYSKQIIHALKHTKEIKEILDKYRKEPLADSWLPVSAFSKKDGTDKIKNIRWDQKNTLSYELEDGSKETADITKDGNIKLPWRVDWPMRWAFEKLDFEPGGKDHSTPGGSRDTGAVIVKEVFGWDAPIYAMYNFIRIKGGSGKISSSAGGVVNLGNCLEIYQPEIVRYFFAGSRPNSEFAISFDLDVNKIYEDYDRCERIYFGKEKVENKKDLAQQKRIYELSQIKDPHEKAPIQIPFLHSSLVVKVAMDEDNAIQILKQQGKIPKKATPEQLKYVKQRLSCALRWIDNYAPEQVKFTLQTKIDSSSLNEKEKKAFRLLAKSLKEKDFDEQSLHQEFYNIGQEAGLSIREIYHSAYKILLNKEKGPKLAALILTVGKNKIAELLEKV